MDRTVDQMVDYCCHCEYSSDNTDYVYKQSMPLVVAHDVQHCHWVRLVLEVNHWELGQNYLV